MLSTKNLCKSYGNLKILNGVSIEVAGAEIVSITGASGAGKSTLLHILGTLDRPDSGQLILDGTDVFKLSDNKNWICISIPSPVT
jgi:lipoprotein-releasing system ATP-binding protein